MNFLEKASKNRVPVAYAVRGLFSRGTPLKTQKTVGLNRESYCWTKNVFPTELKSFRRGVTKTAFCVGLNGGAFKNANDEATRKHFVNFCEKGSKKCVLAA